MNRSLVTSLSIALAAHVSIANADIQEISGTASLYFGPGSPVGMPTPITGEYDTDAQQIIVDPWMFFGMPVNSQIQVLLSGNHSFPGVLPINVGLGQLGGHITTNWASNIIPHGIVWDVTPHIGGRHFEPVDSDGDGVPGIQMISGPFPGLTFVYEFDTGEPAPSIDVDIDIQGGTSQQCNEADGKHVELVADIALKGGAELASVDWSVDGNPAGSGLSVTPFLSLGAHSISVTATGVSGVSDTASTNLQIIDTIKPSLAIEFVDTRSGQTISSVEGEGVSFVEVRLNSTDSCDSNVDVSGVAKPVTAIMGGEVFKIQGNNNNVDMPTTAIEVTATATDDSGNKQLDQMVLPINN